MELWSAAISSGVVDRYVGFSVLFWRSERGTCWVMLPFSWLNRYIDSTGYTNPGRHTSLSLAPKPLICCDRKRLERDRTNQFSLGVGLEQLLIESPTL